MKAVVATSILASLVGSGCGGASPPEATAQHEQESAPVAPPEEPEPVSEPSDTGATDAGAGRLVTPHVQMELSSQYCNRGPRTGRLLWEPVPGAVRYEVDEVATVRPDSDYRSWSEGQWRAGRRTIVDFPAMPEHAIEARYWRVRAVGAGDATSDWAYGAYDCFDR